MSETDFKVGDVVTSDYLIWEVESDNSDNLKGVVTRVDENGNIYILWSDGSCGWHGDGSFYKKTSMFLDIERHILSKLRSYK